MNQTMNQNQVIANPSRQKPSHSDIRDRTKISPTNLLAHPQLWRAGQLSQRTVSRGLTSGYPGLDAQLPGGGWPRAGLTEVLHAQPGLGELRLLAPMLADLSQDENRWIAWINPPAIPYAPALGRFGIRSDRLLMIHPKNHADALWAAEQAARSGTCSAVLVWLDEGRLKNAETRRLQVAAKQGSSLTCLFRPTRAAQHASAAELRLKLHAPSAEVAANKSADKKANPAVNLTVKATGYSNMQVDVLKRRGGWAVDNIDIELVGDDPIRRLQDIQQQLSLWKTSTSQPLRSTPTASKAPTRSLPPRSPVPPVLTEVVSGPEPALH